VTAAKSVLFQTPQDQRGHEVRRATKASKVNLECRISQVHRVNAERRATVANRDCEVRRETKATKVNLECRMFRVRKANAGNVGNKAFKANVVWKVRQAKTLSYHRPISLISKSNSVITKVTTVAGTSSTLGPLTITYTDPDGVVQTITAAAQSNAGLIETSDSGNITTTVLLGVPMMLNCKASTNIQYAFAYASNAANVMAYNLHMKLEALG